MTDSISDLYSLIPKGAFKDEAEFRAFASDSKNHADIYSVIESTGAFTNATELSDYINTSTVKKKEPTQSGFGSLQSPSTGKSNFQTTFEAGLPKPEKGVAGVEDTAGSPTNTGGKTFTEMITASANDAFGRKINQSDNTNVTPVVKGIANPTTGQVEVVDQSQRKKVEQQPVVQKFAGKGEKGHEAKWSELDDLGIQTAIKLTASNLSKFVGIMASDLENTFGDRFTADFSQFGADAKHKKAEDFATYQFGKIIDKWSEETFPVSEQTKKSTLGQTASGIVSLGKYALLAYSGVASGGSAVPLLATAGFIDGMSDEYDQAYKQVNDARTMSDEEYYNTYGNGKMMQEVAAYKQELAQQDPHDVAFKAGLASGAFGTIEAFPVMSWMKRMDQSTGGLFGRSVSKYLVKEGADKAKQSAFKEGFKGAMEEGVQESFQALANNWSAIQIYDKAREITDGVMEQGGVGFLLGGTLNGLTVAIQNKLASNPDMSASEIAILNKALVELETKNETVKNIPDNEVVKPFNDPPIIAELKKKKLELEVDLASRDTPNDRRIQIAEEIQKIDQELETQRNNIREVAVAAAEKEGELADVNSQLETLQAEFDQSTPATQEIIAPEIEQLIAVAEGLKTQSAELQAAANEQSATPGDIKEIINNNEIQPNTTESTTVRKTSESGNTTESVQQVDTKPAQKGKEETKIESEPSIFKNKKNDLKGEEKAPWMKNSAQPDVIEQALNDKSIDKSIKEGRLTYKDAEKIIKGAGLIVPNDIVKGAKNQGKVIKPDMRGKTPASLRKKSPNVEKAINLTPISPLQQALHYFARGNRINNEAIKYIYGDKPGERMARINYYAKDGKSIDRIVDDIYNSQTVPDQFTTEQIREAVIEVIQNYKHPSQMANDLISMLEEDASANPDTQPLTKEQIEAIERQRKLEQDLADNSDVENIDGNENEVALHTLETMTPEQLEAYANDSDSILDEQIDSAASDWLQGLEDNEVESDMPESWNETKSPTNEPTNETIAKFAEANNLIKEIQSAESGTKKRRLAEKRRKMMAENPSIKRIDDNIKSIHEQLEAKGIIERKGDCP